ncbi:riboflavin synthase [Lactobacillus sp. Sy-1]|uniref:riboflavin synthase n=1 Tax=Lactobacillus sp. Sy-1 TaxID=2109645 RepID=UPI001C5BF798|nr:riboflavin synthase [Lactobacillus sp. Sy-1]MBW1605897.1 riboflavin synthase [Lactobacillus sp. Sy-1]
MFTGLIHGTGTVQRFNRTGDSVKLTIRVNDSQILDGYRIGDSLAVDGICLTATNVVADQFDLDVMPATFNKTTMNNWRIGKVVNLERALLVSERFEGHIVSGHVDGVGRLLKRMPLGNAILYQFTFPAELAYGIVAQGSIAINGISLTIQKCTPATFTVSLIPHTADNTNLATVLNGEFVNLETDILSKYVNRIMG